MQENKKRNHIPIAIPLPERVVIGDSIRRTEYKKSVFIPQRDLTNIEWMHMIAEVTTDLAETHVRDTRMVDELPLLWELRTLDPKRASQIIPTQHMFNATVEILRADLKPDSFAFHNRQHLLPATTAYVFLSSPERFPQDILTESLFSQFVANIPSRDNPVYILPLRMLYPDKPLAHDLGIGLAEEESMHKNLAWLREHAYDLDQPDSFARVAAYTRLLFPHPSIPLALLPDDWETMRKLLETFHREGEWKKFIDHAWSMTILSAETVVLAPTGEITLDFTRKEQALALPRIRQF